MYSFHVQANNKDIYVLAISQYLLVVARAMALPQRYISSLIGRLFNDKLHRLALCLSIRLVSFELPRRNALGEHLVQLFIGTTSCLRLEVPEICDAKETWSAEDECNLAPQVPFVRVEHVRQYELPHDIDTVLQ